MLKIGIDKTDKTFRHFEYDDERMYGDPKVFKVLYEETGIFGEVLCSNVISIKKSNSTHNNFLDIPVYSEDKKESQKQEPVVVIDEPVNTPKIIETSDKKKKTKSSITKLKSKSIVSKDKTIENKDTVKDIVTPLSKSYEYDILVIDNVSNIDEIKSKLNESGKDGWEVCGFQIVQKLFSCEAFIIMKKGSN